MEVDETEKLYEDTRSIYEKFSPHKVKPIRDLLCDRAAAAQWLFSNVVLSGMRETHGIELDEPTYKYVTFKRGGSGEIVPDCKWSVGGEAPAAPKLPPRDTPRRGFHGSNPMLAEEREQR